MSFGLKKVMRALRKANDWLLQLDEEDPNEPIYDPVALGGVVIVTLVFITCLYWLLWTLLVYEGGLFPKIAATLAILIKGKKASDFGYEGTPYAMGVFEGWLANLIALGF